MVRSDSTRLFRSSVLRSSPDSIPSEATWPVRPLLYSSPLRDCDRTTWLFRSRPATPRLCNGIFSSRSANEFRCWTDFYGINTNNRRCAISNSRTGSKNIPFYRTHTQTLGYLLNSPERFLHNSITQNGRNILNVVHSATVGTIIICSKYPTNYHHNVFAPDSDKPGDFGSFRTAITGHRLRRYHYRGTLWPVLKAWNAVRYP